MQLESFLEASAQRFPDKTALVFDCRRLTYGEIESRANQLAHVMIARGLDRGDRVAIWLAAYIARSAGSRLTERDVLQHCAQRPEDFMFPTIVEFRGHLPKTPSSKIDKRAIAV